MHVGAEILYRVEPDGHVGVAVFVKSSVPEAQIGGVEYTRRSVFKPAMREGKPVAVTQYDPIYLMSYTETISGSVTMP
jgi:hypothetical protein